MNSNKSFNSYADARKYYEIANDDICLEITDHPKSLNQIIRNNAIIYYVGKGLKSSPGYPSGNQMLYNQLPLLHKFIKDYHVKVFQKKVDDRVYYLGSYNLLRYRKKMSFSGFTYFEFILSRKNEFYVFNNTLYIRK
jgi:hypothetical protein